MRRRQFLAVLGGVASASALGACTNQNDSASPSTAGSASPDAGFPAKVQHRFGTTVVPSAPQKVYTLGQTDHDAAIALGVTPLPSPAFWAAATRRSGLGTPPV